MFSPPRAAEIRRHACRRFAASVAAVAALAFVLTAAYPRAAAAQTLNAGSPDLVISQVYTRGGEPGAAYQHDYVELFNRGRAPVNIGSWALHITQNSGQSPTTIYIRLPTFSYVVEPGRYVLVKLAGGEHGAPLPAPYLDVNLSFIPFPIGLTRSGTVGLLTADGNFAGCPDPGTEGVVDYVGYGPGSACFEGPGGAAPEPTLTQSLAREAGGCSDNDSSKLDFRLGAAAPRNSSTPAAPCAAPEPTSFFEFASAEFEVFEDGERAQVTVTREGDVSAPASVDYATTGGTASERSDYTTAAGRLRFAPGERQKRFDVLLTNDVTQEPTETIGLLLSKPAGAANGARDRATVVLYDNDNGSETTNPSDGSQFFVRQHYFDFLGRDADESGLFFWWGGIDSCGADTGCREVKRIDTSAAFFLSIEFQTTGFLVHRLYRAALPASGARPRSLPRYAEFARDTQEVGRGVVVGDDDWRRRLEANIALYLEDFTSRAEFALAYPATLTASEYVYRLDAEAGSVLTQAERDALIAGLQTQAETRATVLLKVAEHPEFQRREFNRAFVLMQYFGYLRRAPNDAPDADFSGYDFWLSKLNSFGGDYRRAEMVKAFLSSDEYRARFLAPPP
ncbi:MAG TPA: Calx-beta domain-containing protein [Pyrinomonadaceae bacterium]|jgi:hypothetical protein